MSYTEITAARTLLEQQENAVLCTAHADHDGWPFGSVVPYAVRANGDLVVFVSDIAEHTKNLLREPRACVFLTDPAADDRPQAGARLSMLVRAVRPEGDAAATAEQLYFARFPAAEAMRDTHGFHAWILEVDRIRWIAGFGAMGWIERGEWNGQGDS